MFPRAMHLFPPYDFFECYSFIITQKRADGNRIFRINIKKRIIIYKIVIHTRPFWVYNKIKKLDFVIERGLADVKGNDV